MTIHLVGGGWRESAASDVYGMFADEVAIHGGRLVYVLQSGTNGQRFVDLFSRIGIEQSRRVTIARDRELCPSDLRYADGLFVCGGVNPLYRAAMEPAAQTIRDMVAAGMPYAGFSAGAVVAAEVALVGGWQRRTGGRDVPVCPERRNEGLEVVEIGRGLGLVPFAVDVHGTQWGTLTRALHALDAGLIDGCVLVDEDTVLRVAGDKATVAGCNSVYRLRRGKHRATAEVLMRGDVFTSLRDDSA
jgi:cyanophycinase